MKELQFSVEIKSPKERVWATLRGDAFFHDWANLIDEGIHMQAHWKRQWNPVPVLRKWLRRDGPSRNLNRMRSCCPPACVSALYLNKRKANKSGRQDGELFPYRTKRDHDTDRQNRSPSRTGRNIHYTVAQSVGTHQNAGGKNGIGSWRHSADEAVRSMMLHGKNAVGVWEPLEERTIFLVAERFWLFKYNPIVRWVNDGKIKDRLLD